MGGRVLVVDDEPEIRRALRTGLGYHDFDVRAVASGAEALELAGAWRPDVVLVDLGLPVPDGFEVLARLRGRGCRAAVIVISVMPDERDKVRALDLGADDYVVKPFGMRELMARMRAVLRRQAALTDGEPVVSAGDLELDLGRRRGGPPARGAGGGRPPRRRSQPRRRAPPVPAGRERPPACGARLRRGGVASGPAPGGRRAA